MEITDWVSAFAALCSAGAAIFAWRTSSAALRISGESHLLAKEDRRLAALDRFNLAMSRARMQCAILYSAASDARQLIGASSMAYGNFGSSRVNLAIEEADQYLRYAQDSRNLLDGLNAKHSDANELAVIAGLTRDVQAILEVLDANIILVASLKEKWVK